MRRVIDIIANRAEPFLLDSAMNATEASRFLREHHIGGAPVTENGRLVGFCSERDIVYRVVARSRDPDETKVAEIMSPDVLAARPGDTVDQCETMMQNAHVRHLPIIEDGKVIACISLRNLLVSDLSETRFEVSCLTEYIRGA
ncbi:MAG: CBS domain-containing protein [Planctomycetota bacterium]|nr:MAG: CBS domain-containing protein [Planctomycetota bacterium]